MIKKLTLVAAAVAALAAFVMPAAAQAGLKAGGVSLKEGASVTATSANLVTTTAGGTLSCKKVTIHATLASEGTPVVLQPSSVTTEGCLAGGILPAQITSPSVGTIELEGGEGEASATFVSDVPFAGLSGCHLSGTVGFEYASGSSSLTIPGSVLTGGGGSEGCSTEGVIEGEFSLETTGGTPVTIE